MAFMENTLSKIIEEKKHNMKYFHDLIKISFLYFFTVLIRAKEKENFPLFVKNLRTILSVNVDIANWFLNNLSNEYILKENLIFCPFKEMKSVFLDLIKAAIRTVDNSDKNLDELIKEVASKGGTTEAALKVFNENSLKEIVENGIFAAENRAKELNG